MGIQNKNEELSDCQYNVEINEHDGQGEMIVSRERGVPCNGKIKLNVKSNTPTPSIDPESIIINSNMEDSE
jgi:hypothetical protein